MNKKTSLRVFLFSVMALIAACESKTNKIGETIKGDRIAVIEPPGAQKIKDERPGKAPLLARPVFNLSWPQAGYDGEHAQPDAQASLRPQILWKADIGEGSSSEFKLLAQPVLSRGIVYTMDSEGLVRAFDAETGDRKWSFDTTPKDRDETSLGGGVAVDGVFVYATTGNGDVYALRAKTGALVWKRDLQNPLRAAPSVADGRVYAVSIDNQLSALDAATGEILWRHTGIAESATLMGAAGPAVQKDAVFIAYSSGEVFGLRAQNGRVAWSYSLASAAQVGALPAIADIRGLPVSEGGRLYAISHSGRFAAIDQRTGDRVWEADIGGIDTPVVSGDAVFIYGGDGQLMALEKNTGRVTWAVSLPKNEDPSDKDSDLVVWAGPVLAADRLWMVNSEGKLQSFSPADGAAFDAVDLGDPVYLPPIVANRTFYIVTDDGTLLALR